MKINEHIHTLNLGGQEAIDLLDGYIIEYYKRKFKNHTNFTLKWETAGYDGGYSEIIINADREETEEERQKRKDEENKQQRADRESKEYRLQKLEKESAKLRKELKL